ncbi:hypothetical protein HAX54_051202 [Datura stramonium]|uniref:Terpene synthase metal-binding domain-containing protein n=1 Tax=Datura stramonium TaxID=4076 RepID=A0ABS8SXC8_DATST|nr:hypothetical protein [Datura stramonium]
MASAAVVNNIIEGEEIVCPCVANFSPSLCSVSSFHSFSIDNQVAQNYAQEIGSIEGRQGTIAMISIVMTPFDAYGIVKELDIHDAIQKSGYRARFLEWLSKNPKILEANATLCRVIDDIATYEAEKSRGQIGTRIEKHT